MMNAEQSQDAARWQQVHVLRDALRDHRDAIEAARRATLRALVPDVPETFYDPMHVYAVQLPFWMWARTADFCFTETGNVFSYMTFALTITGEDVAPLLVDVTQLKGEHATRDDIAAALAEAVKATGGVARTAPTYWPRGEA